MQEIIDVNTGQVAVRRGDVRLRSMAIGSCIAITAYDPKTKNAGLAHIMLPDSAPEKFHEKTKYAFNGIDQMLRKMIESGSAIDDIEACLVGAGNVLQKEDDTICKNNIKSVTAILSKKNIPVRASALGGQERKSAFLDARTGCVFFTQGNEYEKMLWDCQKQNPCPLQFSGKVLLAEDSKGCQVLTQRNLDQFGLEVDIVANGRDAIDKILQQSYDLILMDMKMPYMDGYEATEELRKKGVKTPIVALTAYAMTPDREKCLNAGCDEYISKPVDIDQLVKILKEYLPVTEEVN
jgi:CheY-like chemotaxis protein/chemotaxis receptor (MCP) glutamine deamidase CheD